MNKSKKIDGYILSAIDMEEDFAERVYADYMERTNWPANINQRTYLKIQSLLTTLINDSARHKQILLDLKKRLSEK